MIIITTQNRKRKKGFCLYTFSPNGYHAFSKIQSKQTSTTHKILLVITETVKFAKRGSFFRSGYLPINGVEEPNEVVVGWTQTSAELGGEFLNEIRHLFHVLLHSWFQVLHCFQLFLSDSDPKPKTPNPSDCEIVLIC